MKEATKSHTIEICIMGGLGSTSKARERKPMVLQAENQKEKLDAW
jgi:hypothetical protein